METIQGSSREEVIEEVDLPGEVEGDSNKLVVVERETSVIRPEAPSQEKEMVTEAVTSVADADEPELTEQGASLEIETAPVEKPSLDLAEIERELQKLRSEGNNFGEIRALVRYGREGFPEMLAEAGQRIFQLPVSTETRKRDAVGYFVEAADLGVTKAQFYAGECFVLGKGIEKDQQLGTYYLKKAVENEDHRAMDLLGVCFSRGWGLKKDSKKAAALFEQAIELGNLPAYFNLGGRYAEGDGVAKDPSRAADLFQEGAGKGDAQSMMALARCLEHGFGRNKDSKQAEEWYVKAAKANNPQAIDWCRKNNVVIAQQ